MNLSEIRQEIDRIDAQLVPLLQQRMECSRSVAEAKRGSNTPVLNRLREQEILDKINQGEHGPHLQEIYRCLMGESRAFQYEILDKAAEITHSLEQLPRKLAILKLAVYADQKNILPEFPHIDSLEAILHAINQGNYTGAILAMEQYSPLQLAMQLCQQHLHVAERTSSGSLLTITKDLYFCPDAKNTALLLTVPLSALPWCFTRIQESHVPLYTMASQILSENTQVLYLELASRPDTRPMEKLLSSLEAEAEQLYLIGIY